MGKLRYCSPEQAGVTGVGGALDHRSDLYSFGLVLYEMIAGLAPFESENPNALHLQAPLGGPAAAPRAQPERGRARWSSTGWSGARWSASRTAGSPTPAPSSPPWRASSRG